ncbi:DNA polymerase III, beta subunit [Paenibacillaceae bacterium GAS479]|nr:DNA polymerase III, beta subunit [Paenibacillaceae bacterium GAS479]
MRSLFVQVTKDSLLNALQHVLRAVSANSPIPILSGINIQAQEGGLMLSASNTSLTIESRISPDNIDLQRTGEIVVPARYFNEIIRKLNAGLITLEVKEHLMLFVTSGGSQIRLCGMDSAEFPSIRNTEGYYANKLQINNALLKSTIKQVAVAASTSEARRVLTGVSLEYKDDALSLTATDGVRLASRTLSIERNPGANVNIVIPGKNLIELTKMLQDEEASTEIEIGVGQIRFTTNELQVQSALIEGTFPSITRLIPKSYLSEIRVETDCLLHAVERVSVLASGNIVRLGVVSNRLELRSKTSEIGDVQDEMPIESRTGGDFNISLNSKYFIDLLRCIESEYVKVRFTGKTSPIVALPTEEQSSSLFLVSPVITGE